MSVEVRTQLPARADRFVGVLGIGVLGLLWTVATYGGFVREVFLPTPWNIVEGMLEFHERGWLLPAVWRSFSRVTLSLIFVVACGVPLGVLMGSFATFDALTRKIINGAKSIPTTGLVGLIVLWFSIGEKAMIAFLYLSAIFYMIILVRDAVRNVSEDYIRVALDLGASRRQAILSVLVPGALPQIWDAFAVCNGIMWTYIVLAEFINSNQENLGLGYLLQIGSRGANSGKVFGTLIIIALVSAFTDFVLQTVRKRFLSW
jgi:NitT/TauT family transport system permease protein